jgi:hypothetical protein
MQQFTCFRFVGYIWLYNINDLICPGEITITGSFPLAIQYIESNRVCWNLCLEAWLSCCHVELGHEQIRRVVLFGQIWSFPRAMFHLFCRASKRIIRSNVVSKLVRGKNSTTKVRTSAIGKCVYNTVMQCHVYYIQFYTSLNCMSTRYLCLNIIVVYLGIS